MKRPAFVRSAKNRSAKSGAAISVRDPVHHRGHGGMLGKRERPRGARPFCFSTLSSGYQVRRIGLPNIFDGFGGDVVWNQWALLWCGGAGVDTFCGADRDGAVSRQE